MPPPSTPTTNNTSPRHNPNQPPTTNESTISSSNSQDTPQRDPSDLSNSYADAYRFYHLRRRSNPHWSVRSSLIYPGVPFYMNQPANISDFLDIQNNNDNNTNNTNNGTYDVASEGEVGDGHNQVPYRSHPSVANYSADFIRHLHTQNAFLEANLVHNHRNQAPRAGSLQDSIRQLAINNRQRYREDYEDDEEDEDQGGIPQPPTVGFLDSETDVAYSDEDAALDEANAVDEDDEFENDLDNFNEIDDEDDEDDDDEDGDNDEDIDDSVAVEDSELNDNTHIEITNDNEFRDMLMEGRGIRDYQVALEGSTDEEMIEQALAMGARERLYLQRQTQAQDQGQQSQSRPPLPFYRLGVGGYMTVTNEGLPGVIPSRRRPSLPTPSTGRADPHFNRLLLSSARQSYLNPSPNINSYIDNESSLTSRANTRSFREAYIPPYLNANTAAPVQGEDRDRFLLLVDSQPLPLRRQNAIRLRRSNPYYNPETKEVVINDNRVFDKKDRKDKAKSEEAEVNDIYEKYKNGDGMDYTWKHSINNEARMLHSEITNYLTKTKSSRSYQGKSPLFPMNQFKQNFAYFFLPTKRSIRHEGSPLNLEFDMDMYLKRRRLELLWLGSDITRGSKARSRKVRKIKPVLKASKRKSSKLVTIDEAGGTGKKQKIGHEVDNEEAMFYKDTKSNIVQSKIYHPFVKSESDEDYTVTLSKSDKQNIMDVQFTSFFQSGVRYRILLENYKPTNSECDLVFSDINYQHKSIQGFFQFQEYDASDIDPYKPLRRQLETFAKYFCGLDKDFYKNNYIKNDNIRRKLNILDKLLQETELHDSILKNSRSGEVKLISIPMEGEIIDFKSNDLRFLPNLKIPDNKTYANRHHRHQFSNAIKLKSSRIRIQVLEWMKLQPFQQFKQNCLLNYLQILRKNLINFSNLKIPVFDASESASLLNSFTSNLEEIKEDFAYIKRDALRSRAISQSSSTSPSASSTSAAEQISQSQGIQPGPPPPPPPPKQKGLDDWERTLAHKLCELITDEESTSLLNIQLNYVLFTLKVDVSSYLDGCINFFLDNCHDDKQQRVAKYKLVLSKILKDESKERSFDDNKFATLLCSINRKSGALEIHNTLPYLHYKDINPKHSSQVISRVMGTGSSGRAQSDFEIFPPEDRQTLPSSFGDLPRDFNSHQPIPSSKLSGSLKRDYSIREVGSGNSSFKMV